MAMDVRGKLAELINEFYGCDPMYYGIDALAMAQHLIANGVTVQVCKLEELNKLIANSGAKLDEVSE